ncbi:MAG: THO complex subunit 1, partial [Paramarteilia canceri]
IELKLQEESVANELGISGRVNNPESLVSEIANLFETSQFIEACQIFPKVSRNIGLLQSENYFKISKNICLRTFNDFLKRSSKLYDSQLCGQINLFLSELLPFSEKSGVNLMGYFSNRSFGNSTQLKNTQTENKLFGHLSGLTEHTFSQNFYNAFYSLKKQLLATNFILNDIYKFNSFKNNTDIVIDVIKKYLKSNNNLKCWSIPFQNFVNNKDTFNYQIQNEVLLLSLFTEIVISFNYLLAPSSKFRQKNPNGIQRDWLKKKRSEVLNFIETSYPDLHKLLNNLLKSEGNWSNWKTQGCPDLEIKQYKFENDKINDTPKICDVYNDLEAEKRSSLPSSLWNCESEDDDEINDNG